MKKTIALALVFVFLIAFAASGDTVTLTIEGGASVTFDADLRHDWVELDENGEIPGSLYPVKELGKYGYINEKGEMVIKPTFTEAARFHEGYAVVKLMGLYGYVNKAGRLVIPYQFDEAKQFSEGLAAVKRDGKWGYINTSGEVVVPFQYEAGGSFSEGRAAVAETVDENKRYGYIDETGKKVIPFEYSSAESFSGGLARVRYPEEYYHFIDVDGKTANLAPGIYGSFSEGLARREMKQYCYRFIDTSGQKVTKDYWYAYPYFSEGLTVVADSYGQYYYINTKGQRAFGNVTFQSAKPFSDGYAVVELHNFMLYDLPVSSGRPASPRPIYDKAYINRYGEYVNDKVYHEAGDFEDGFAIVREYRDGMFNGMKVRYSDYTRKLINKNFEVVWEFED